MKPNNSPTEAIVSRPSGVRGDRPALLLEGVLSSAECAERIAAATRKGFDATGARYPAGYRNNDRLVLDDPAWAERLFERLKHLLPEEWVDEAGLRWRLEGLNPRFRYCRYHGGQSFSRHQDGAWAPSPGRRSWLTCQVYLNDAGEFEGGATRYFAGREADAELWGEVRPIAGAAIVFDHRLWHDGAPVISGTKYVMRTDVLYRCVTPSAHHGRSLGEAAEGLSGHAGYVWATLARRDGTLATGSRDKTIRLWRDRRQTAVLSGHDASVFALAEDSQGRLWSGSRDGTVRRWLESGESEIVGRHAGAVLALAALDDGGVVSGGADGLIKRWTHDGGCAAEAGGYEGWIWTLARLDATNVISGSADGTLRVWDTTAGLRTRCVHRVDGIIRKVGVQTQVDLPNTAHLIAVGFESGQVSLWNTDGGSFRHIATAPVHDAAVSSLTALADGGFASASEDGTGKIIEVPSLAIRASFPHQGFVRSVAELPSGEIVTGADDGLVRIWRR